MVAVLSEVGQCVKTRMEKKPNNYLFLTLGFGWGGGAWVYDHAKAGCWTGDGRTSKLIGRMYSMHSTRVCMLLFNRPPGSHPLIYNA